MVADVSLTERINNMSCCDQDETGLECKCCRNNERENVVKNFGNMKSRLTALPESKKSKYPLLMIYSYNPNSSDSFNTLLTGSVILATSDDFGVLLHRGSEQCPYIVGCHLSKIHNFRSTHWQPYTGEVTISND